jgi:ABC-type glycerol-3-phosphate transport system substrate-binding protein
MARRLLGASVASKTVTLDYLNNWGIGNDTHSKVLGNLIKSFEKSHPAIRVNSQNVDANTLVPKTRTDCASGACPDIIHQFDPSYWRSGWVLNLSPYVTGAWKERFVPISLQQLTINGKLYALPLEVSPLVTIWNTKAISDLGGTVPTTWSEFLALGKLAQAKGISLLSFQNNNDFMTNLVWGHPAGPAAMAKGQWDNPAVRYLADRIKDIKDLGLNPPNDASIDFGAATALFQQGKLLCMCDGAWTINNNLTPGGKDTFGLADNLAFTPGVKPDVSGSRRAMRYYSNGVSLSAALKSNPAKLDAALAFMNYWTTKRQAELWVAGAQDPTGVRVPVPRSLTLLNHYSAAQSKAQVLYPGPKPLFMIGAIWTAFTPLFQGILGGESVDDAVKGFVAAQNKAQKQFALGH